MSESQASQDLVQYENQHQPDQWECECQWHGHCFDIPVETIAHIFGFVNMLFSSAELLCYTVLCSALHIILERQKEEDINVCDMSLKTFDDPDDDCEVKASKVAAALLGTSVFEVIISFLALRGAYTTNIYLCYIWFVFTSLLVIMFPLFQSLFFVVTNWWNAISYGIMSMVVIHSVIKLYGMYIIIRYVKWVRKESYIARDRQLKRSKAVASHATTTVEPSGPDQQKRVTYDQADETEEARRKNAHEKFLKSRSSTPQRRETHDDTDDTEEVRRKNTHDMLFKSRTSSARKRETHEDIHDTEDARKKNTRGSGIRSKSRTSTPQRRDSHDSADDIEQARRKNTHDNLFKSRTSTQADRQQPVSPQNKNKQSSPSAVKDGKRRSTKDMQKK